MVLAEIERRTKQPIHKLFDLIAGTSTGGILALSLVKPGKGRGAHYKAADMVQLYETQGRRIFSRSLVHQVLSLGSLVNKKYQSGPVESVLKEYFGNARLSQALTNVLVTSYDIRRRDAFFFRSYRAKIKENYDFPMRNVARATSAAPTYFAPESLKGKDRTYALIDGGVFANNPSLCAVADAVQEFGKDLEEIFMVSLGTGEQHRPLDARKVMNWGAINWAQPVISIVFQSLSDTIHYQTEQVLNEEGKPKRYHRFQIRLPDGVFGLDSVSPASIRSLKDLGETIIRDSNDEIDALCKALKRRSPARKRARAA
jgi:patatin-like phospholipase/acyl hydrolase